jgi:light-regulated signal transduction histidine kinase (bacteriophytochrome)/anti-sigma regulatory factor (Ser/Thr protein kinase)
MNQFALLYTPEQLTACDHEPIHLPGAIQPHGALLAFDRPGPDRQDLVVRHAGGATLRLLGHPAAALPGQTAAAVLGAAAAARLAAQAGSIGSHPQPCALGPETLAQGAEALLHASGPRLLLELEPRPETEPDDPLGLVQTMLHPVTQAPTPEAFANAAVAAVRAATGFQRVMVYRFLEDGSGAVIAESRDEAPGLAIESFLGLHYPESDIPKQARALYRDNWARAIPDARYAPAPLLPPCAADQAKPLDLGRAVLRSVSPLHRQYMANMGVVASLTLSLVVQGRLWGLVACHHDQPRYLPQRLRVAMAMFAEMASAQLEMKLTAATFQVRLLASSVHEELIRRMSQEVDLAEGLTRFRPNLTDLIPASGVGLWFDGAFSGMGATPSAAQVAALVAWLGQHVGDGVFHTDCLARHHPAAKAYADVASGVLALSVSRSPRDYVLWFRPEVVRTVTWAGAPTKPIGPDAMLSPRASFAAWQERVRLHATPWHDMEVETAQRLRVSLLEVVLRRIDQLAREREAARELQDGLLHRLDRQVAEWQTVAQALRQETERRGQVEAELSQVLHRTVLDQEAERLRIARELHDQLGQSLTLLQLGIEDIGRASPESAEVQRRVAALKGLATELGREVSRLAWEIRPAALDELGLQAAMRSLLEAWSASSGVRFDLEVATDAWQAPAAVETTLYRVLQEGLTNVARHARASRVGVVLGMADGQANLIIEDDGCGFDAAAAPAATRPAAGAAPPHAAPPRLGLRGMRERLALVGGTLEIEAAPGRGTALFVRVPL